MRYQKLDWGRIPQPVLLQFMNIESAFCLKQVDRDTFIRVNAAYELIAFYDGERMIGFALVTPGYCRTEYCICMEKLRYLWEYNTEAWIEKMVSAVACVYYEEGKTHFVMNVSKRYDMNFELYQKIGFQKAIIPSPKGKEYSILFDSVSRLSALCEVAKI